MTFGTNQITARTSWLTPYTFEPYGNGLGVLVSVNSATATQGTLPGNASGNVNCLLINNMGSSWVNVLWGDSTTRATTSSLAVPPNTQALYSVTIVGEAAPTTLSVIGTASSASTVQATLGLGGV